VGPKLAHVELAERYSVLVLALFPGSPRAAFCIAGEEPGSAQ